MKNRNYSYFGTLAAIAVILLAIILNKYIFKGRLFQDSGEKETEAPTQFVYEAVPAEISPAPTE